MNISSYYVVIKKTWGMGVDWSHTRETSINYHQAGPNMETTRKEDAQEIRGEGIS